MKKLLAALLITLSAYAHADRVVIYADSSYPPITYLQEGEPEGILYRKIKSLEQYTGDVYEFRLVTWSRALNESLSGKGCITDLSWNSDRAKIYDYSKPIFTDTLNIVTLTNNAFEFKGVADLKGKVIGKASNSSLGDVIDKQMAEHLITFDYDTSQEIRLRKLLSDKIDAAIIGTGREGLRTIMLKDEFLLKNMHRFAILPVPLVEDQLHVGCLKTMNMKRVLDRIDKALEKLPK